MSIFHSYEDEADKRDLRLEAFAEERESELLTIKGFQAVLEFIWGNLGQTKIFEALRKERKAGSAAAADELKKFVAEKVSQIIEAEFDAHEKEMMEY